MSGILPPGRYSRRMRTYRVNCSVKEEDDEGDDELQTSKPAAADVHIMTTKVQVPDDVKKVRPVCLPR